MEENLEYWEDQRDQRIEDIRCETAIGSPDSTLTRILINALEEANEKIIEING
tara:strand:- start:126 stop:284 length:159 start_codon:yes stop_codon:yes gene_type:complete